MVKLSKISQFTAKRHCLQPLYKCTHVGEEELLYSAARRSDTGSYYHNRRLPLLCAICIQPRHTHSRVQAPLSFSHAHFENKTPHFCHQPCRLIMSPLPGDKLSQQNLITAARLSEELVLHLHITDDCVSLLYYRVVKAL